MYQEIEFCEHVKSLYFDNNSNSLLVFLPAANGIAIHPRYPRFKWAKDFSEFSNVLYLSDPYQGEVDFIESNGSWYINNKGEFILPHIASELSLWLKSKSITRVVFYGSSMGGYAAIVLSSLISSSVAIAECPQLFLNKHPGSKYVLDNFFGTVYSGEIDAFEFVKNSKASKLVLACSIYDSHYEAHFLPFVNCYKEKKLGLDVEFISFYDPIRGKGHVALQEKRSYDLIFSYLK